MTRRLKQALLVPLGAELKRAIQRLSAGWLNSARGGVVRTGAENYLRHLIHLGGLRPEHNVLDIGCAAGRIAGPLARCLDPGCQEVDINGVFKPHGNYRAPELSLPFADDSFDFIFLTSVFTHMLPPDMENYLAEIARLLKPEGKSLITFFLLNAESRRLTKTRRSLLRFAHDRGDYALRDDALPEAAVAYDEDYIRRLYRQYGLRMAEPIHHGGWCGRPACVEVQDIIIATKTRTAQRLK